MLPRTARDLSTAVKMILILTAALLPLGLIAVLAAVESAHSNRLARDAATRIVAQETASRLGGAIGRFAVTMRATATALALNPAGSENCRRTLESLASRPDGGTRVAIFRSGGGLLCATDGFRPGFSTSPPTGSRYGADLSKAGDAISVTVRGATGATVGVGELSRSVLANLVRPRGGSSGAQVTLFDGARALPLSDQTSGTAHQVATASPVAGGQLRLDLVSATPPIRPVVLLTLLLPIAMLIAAALIGWLVMDRLVLRPLAQLQRAVAAYQPGGQINLPSLSTPAMEIRRLSEAFAAVTATVAQHEAELEEGLARQTRLTREVHHRVKNNLQVVASLINLHSRGAIGPETIAAYASIQRRVDALAIVHRNHYAEYEQNRGVALKPLIQELSANLRGSAGAVGPHLSIAVSIEPLHTTQDTAVAVAFLVTELVELALLTDARSAITIQLGRSAEHRALLTIAAASLRPSALLDQWLSLRFGRVIEGLARQMRARMQRSETNGSYSLEVATVD